MRKIFTIIFTILFALTACGQNAPTWQEQYDLSIRYLSEGNYEEAIIAFTAVIEINEKHSDSYFGRGWSYHGLANALIENKDTYAKILQDFVTEDEKLQFCYEHAIQDYKKAIELDPGVAKYYDEIMLTALEYGDIDLLLQYGEQKYQNVEDIGLQEIFENASLAFALMEHLAEAFFREDNSEIFALMQGESYQALLTLQEYLKRPILRKYGEKTLGSVHTNKDML